MMLGKGVVHPAQTIQHNAGDVGDCRWSRSTKENESQSDGECAFQDTDHCRAGDAERSSDNDECN